MAKRKIKFNKFEIPESYLDTLYEFSGSLDKNKGYILFYIDENGTTQVRQKFDSQATEFALTKVLEIFANENIQTIHFESDEFSESENEEDD